MILDFDFRNAFGSVRRFIMTKKLTLIVIFLFFSTMQLTARDTLRFGILPVIDTLPLQVAVKEGFFAEQDLDVELVPFRSAMERNTGVQSGQLDGFFGDMIATIIMVNNDIPVKFLTISYYTNPSQKMFGLVTSPKLKSGDKGKTLTVAISKATIIEYLLSYIKDLPVADDFVYDPVEIVQMPIRLQMLLAGKIDSALLPEPLASLAISKGAELLATDQTLNMPLTVLNIHKSKLSLADAFIKAYQKAVDTLNKNPEAYRELMAKTCRIPKPMVKSFPMYQYPQPRVPTEQEVDQVQNWMIKVNLIDSKALYSDLIP